MTELPCNWALLYLLNVACTKSSSNAAQPPQCVSYFNHTLTPPFTGHQYFSSNGIPSPSGLFLFVCLFWGGVIYMKWEHVRILIEDWGAHVCVYAVRVKQNLWKARVKENKEQRLRCPTSASRLPKNPRVFQQPFITGFLLSDWICFILC